MDFKGKKVLVTGGAGFIGSNLVDRLVEEQADVIVLDDLFTGDPKNIRHFDKICFGRIFLSLNFWDTFSTLFNTLYLEEFDLVV